MEKPHVIIICADHLRYDVLVKDFTPNIDALAEESSCFENAYCACPLCVPAHGSLFTAGLKPEERHDSKTRWLTTEKTYREYLTQNKKPLPGGPRFRSPVPEILSRSHTIFTTCSNADTGRYEPGENYYFDNYFTAEAIRQTISHIDVLPTLCHYLGLEPGQDMEGRSLHTLMEQDCPEETPSRPVFIQYNGNSCLSGYQRCVIDVSLKLIMDVFQKETFFELYSTADDPEETTNLLFEDGYTQNGARLFTLLCEHMARTGDSLVCPTDAYEHFTDSASLPY